MEKNSNEDVLDLNEAKLIAQAESINDYFKNEETSKKFINSTMTSVIDKIISKGGEKDVMEAMCEIAVKNIKYNENNKIYIKNLKNIFDFGKYFYKGTYGHNNFNHDIYNRMRLNINQEVISKEFKGYHLNDIVDIEYEADNEILWRRGKIINITDDQIDIKIPLCDVIQTIPSSSIYKIAKKGTYTIDYDSLVNININSVVFYKTFKGTWKPCTVIKIDNYKDSISNMTSPVYTIEERVYVDDNKEDIGEYSKYWDSRGVNEKGRKFIGSESNEIDLVSFISNRIMTKEMYQKHVELTLMNTNRKIIFDRKRYNIDKYVDDVVIGRKSFMFSEYTMDVIDIAIKNGIIDTMKEALSNDELSYEYLCVILSFIRDIAIFLNINYAKKISKDIIETFVKFINDIKSKKDILKNITKDNIDIITSIISFFASASESDININEIIIELAFTFLSLSFSLKLIAIKLIYDVISTSPISIKISLIESVINKGYIDIIFAKSSHIQLITSSLPTLSLFALADQLDKEKIMKMLSASEDIEHQIIVYKFLIENTNSFDDDKVSQILSLIYSEDVHIVNEEKLNAMYYLSRKNDFVNSVRYIMKMLYANVNNDITMMLIGRICDFTKFDEECRKMVIDECIDKLKQCEYSLYCYKLLMKMKNENRSQYEEIYRSNCALYLNKVNEYKKTIKEDENIFKAIIEDNIPHNASLIIRIEFMNYLLDSHLWNDANNPIIFLYDFLVKNELSREFFYKWLNIALQKKIISDISTAFSLFNSITTIDELQCFMNIFFTINNLSLQNLPIIESPSSLKGFDIIWTTMLSSNIPQIINNTINVISMLYRNKANDLISKLTSMLLISNDKKHIITIIKRLIEKNELRGTNGHKSHSAIIRDGIIDINIISYIIRVNNFECKCYCNTTIWELKKLIADKIKINADFICASLHKDNYDYDISLNENGATIKSFALHHHIDYHRGLYVKIRLNTDLLNSIPKEKIILNGEINVKLIQIFREWFNRYAQEGKMYDINISKFIRDVTNSRSEVPLNDHRLLSLLSEYDREKRGYITENDFVAYFSEAAKSQQKSNVLWDNISAMGYRNDLKKLSDELHKEDEHRKIFRYEIAQDDKVFNMLISDADDNSDLLNFLCDNSKIRNEIIEFKFDFAKAKSNKLLIYAMEIVLSLVESIEFNDTIELYVQWNQRLIKEGYIDIITSLLYEAISNKDNNDIYIRTLIKIIHIYLKKYINIESKEDHCDIFNDDDIKNKIQCVVNNEELISKLLLMNSDTAINIDAFELLCNLISFYSNETTIINSSFIETTLKIINSTNMGDIEKRIFEAVITMIKTNCRYNKFKIICKFYDDIYKDIIEKKEKSKAILLRMFAIITEIYSKNKDNMILSFNVDDTLHLMVSSLLSAIENNLIYQNEVYYIFIIDLLTIAIDNIDTFISYISSTEILSYLINIVLFPTKSPSIPTDSLINYTQYKSSPSSHSFLRSHCYRLLYSLLKSSSSSLSLFFNSFSILSSLHSSAIKSKYHPSTQPRCYDYIGIRNLSCICYMNSIVQQFYMCALLRNAVLSIDSDINDTFNQAQKLFSYLSLSNRSDVIPFDFVNSFSDIDINAQQDANEFMIRFIDIIDTSLSKTIYKYVINDIYKGKIASTITCTSCGHVKRNEEEFTYISLPLLHCHTLAESISKFLAKETIRDYKCDGCHEKTDIEKKSILSSLPNILIFTLQRLVYDYEEECNKKINSMLQFPFDIDLSSFSESDDDIYELVGINVHIGDANMGHYVSIIRDSNGRWIMFNDSIVEEFDKEKIGEFCFGRNKEEDNEEDIDFFMSEPEKSAYILFYERKKKKDIRVLVKEESDEVKYVTEIEGRMRRSVFEEIIIDNFNFQKGLDVNDNNFLLFFDNLINMLTHKIEDNKELIPKIVNEYMIMINYILSSKDNIELLIKAKKHIDSLLETSQSELIRQTILKYISNNIEIFAVNVINKSKQISEIHLDILSSLISQLDSYDESIIDILHHLFDLFDSHDITILSSIYPLTSFMVSLLSYKAFNISIMLHHIDIFISFINENSSIVINRSLSLSLTNLIKCLLYLYKHIDDSNKEMLTMKLKEYKLLSSLISTSLPLYSEITSLLSFSDLNYTREVCSCINSYIEQCSLFSNISDISDIIVLVASLSDINDDFRHHRMEILIGRTSITFNDVKNCFDITIESANRIEGMSIMKKINSLQDLNMKSMCCLCLLNQCTKHPFLYQYINTLILQSGYHFISFTMNNISSDNIQYYDALNQTLKALNYDIKEEHKGEYSFGDVVKEIITIEHKENDFCIFRVESYTKINTVIEEEENECDKNIDINDNYKKILDDIDIDTDDHTALPVKTSTDDHITYYKSNSKQYKERLFFNELIDVNNRKAIVDYSSNDNEKSYLTIIRYIAMNNSNSSIKTSIALSSSIDNNSLPHEKVSDIVKPGTMKTMITLVKKDPEVKFEFEDEIDKVNMTIEKEEIAHNKYDNMINENDLNDPSFNIDDYDEGFNEDEEDDDNFFDN